MSEITTEEAMQVVKDLFDMGKASIEEATVIGLLEMYKHGRVDYDTLMLRLHGCTTNWANRKVREKS